jgi:YD repeat-containing protein
MKKITRKNMRSNLWSLGALMMFAGFLSSGDLYGQNVSVDPLSGAANVSIPIYTLNYGSISVPINLNHSGSSLKVEEGDGDAGLGWNLSCNYGVYRQVRGLPDDGTGGWLSGSTAATINSFTPSSDDSFSTSTDEATDFNTINGFGYQADTEPDLYTVVGPGLYFQFVYDASGTPRLLEYQDVKITIIALGGGFTVQNNTGKTYSFQTKETVSRQAYAFNGANVDFFISEYNRYSAAVMFTDTWYLSSVTDPVGNTVNFNYSPLAQAQDKSFRNRVINYNTTPDTLYFVTDTYSPQALASITAGNYTVNFTWTSSKLLSSIKVSESGLSDNFQYGFVYQVAQAITNTSFPYYDHYFLRQIIPSSSANCTPQTPYSFGYQGVTVVLPTNAINGVSNVDFSWNNYFGQDMWGQYNAYSGARSTQGVPPVFFNTGLTDSRRFSMVTIPGAPNVPLAGSTRNVQSSKVGIGSLIQINYPTGGYTKIVWERNKYLDSLSNQVLFGPGLRVASLISDGGEAAFGRNANASASNPYHQIIKTYTYQKSETDTTTSGLVSYPPEYGLATGGRFMRTTHDQSPGGVVSYRRVKETTTQGSTVYVYSLPAVYPATSYSTDWTAAKSKVARNPATQQAVANLQNGYYTYPFAPNPNYGFAQGLLTSVTEYSAATMTTPVRQKQYYYSRINPALQSVYGLRYEYLGTTDCDCFHFSKYQVITGTTSVLTKQVTSEVSETNSAQTEKVTTIYHYNSDVVNNNFLMDSVRTVWGDGSVSRKKIKYVKDYAAITTPTSTDIMASAIPLMITANRHGEVVEQISTFTPAGGAATTVGASLQLFKNFGSNKVYPYKTFSFPEGMTLTPSYVITGATQGFFFDSTKYILSGRVNDIDAAGNPVSISDAKQNKIAYHNALNYSLPPVASFANATAKQTVYEGFEFSTGRNLTPSTGLSYVGGWTGQQAATLTSTNALTNSAVSNAGVPYRVSCWVNAAQNSTVTFQFTNLAGATTTLNYTTPNQWVYLEGIINVTTATPSTLNLQVTANATIAIDDILVLPQSATASTKTFLPLKGATSQTDDRGNSTTVTYDMLGRKVNTFDRQRNLVEFDQYQMKGAPKSYINAAFTWTNPLAGSALTAALSGAGNCFSGVSYQWQLNNVNIGTNSPNLNYTIANAGIYNLTLTVTNTITQQFVTEPHQVTVWAVPPTLAFTSLPAGNTLCNNVGPFPYTISISSGCGSTTTNVVQWYMSSDGTNYTLISGSTTTSASASVSYVHNVVPGYYIKAVVTQTCGSGNAMTVSNSAQIVQQITVTQCTGN